MQSSEKVSGNNFSLQVGQGYISLKPTDLCESTNVRELETTLTTKMVDPFCHVVVDCDRVKEMSSEWLRFLLGTQLTLKNLNKSLRLFNVGSGLESSMRKSGVDKAFTRSKTLKDALIELGLAQKKTLDTEFINPFLDATLKVLEVQATVTATPGKPFRKKESDKTVADVSGVIGIVSDAFNGSVIISFPKATFLKVMSNMLGEELTEISKDIVDGTAEILNMIFGQAKIVLNNKGYGIKTALPSVISGKDHELRTETAGTTVIIPFESSAGQFFVEISISA